MIQMNVGRQQYLVVSNLKSNHTLMMQLCFQREEYHVPQIQSGCIGNHIFKTGMIACTLSILEDSTQITT